MRINWALGWVMGNEFLTPGSLAQRFFMKHSLGAGWGRATGFTQHSLVPEARSCPGLGCKAHHSLLRADSSLFVLSDNLTHR